MTGSLHGASNARAALDRELPPRFVLAGRYRLDRELARGGMGIVYLAEHLALGREVALKTLNPKYLHDPMALRRFEREARAAASIGHPGIVDVLDFGSDGEVSFLVMERLSGEDLRHRIAHHGPLPIERARAIGAEMASAVAAAHRGGIVHRDLSPRNVFLARDAFGREAVKILDFGIAKLTEPRTHEPVTQSHQALGTLMYMAPERVADAAVCGPAVDIYAIGVLLYEAIAGVPPFPLCAPHELALKIALEVPPALSTLRPDCPHDLTAIVERAMHKDPAQRWRSADALAVALEGGTDLEQEGTALPRTRAHLGAWLAAAGAALAIGLVAAPAWLPGRTPPAAPAARAIAGAAPTPATAPDLARTVPPGVPAAPDLGKAIPPAEPAIPSEGASASATGPTPLRRVEVASQPTGALVLVGGRGRCRTPCAVELPAGESSVVAARLKGHRTRWQRVTAPPPGRLELRLERAVPASPEPVAEPPAEPPLPALLPRR